MVDLNERLKAMQQQLVQKQEEFLLQFFGSMENAKRYGHLFVLESYPTKLDLKGLDENTQTYSMSQEFRIRRKTDEELAAEHAAHEREVEAAFPWERGI
jgi:hypothetical protein